ncbi:MAG: glycosyltransferase family 9 protein [Bacteroidota bacterium]|nr:glycosyltransferase family 9 protein [Bacteroidota bacterium]
MKNVIISRTDNLGDVILTLPLAGVIKKHFPGCTVWFLGKSYTRPLISLCRNVDHFLDRNDLSSLPSADAIIHVFPDKEVCKAAKKAGIPIRIATSHRWFTRLYCNHVISFSRRRSDLHEAQLNLKLLQPLGIHESLSLEKIPEYYGFELPRKENPSSPEKSNKKKIILHPRSKGSAREWGLDNYSRLISLLPENLFEIYITGTREEGESMSEFLKKNSGRIQDMTGRLTLPELVAFIDQCDVLIAASTGPLHIAAALGKKVIGLYAPIRPMHPGRWAPLGKDAHFLVIDKVCSKCRRSGDCECIRSILPEEVVKKIREQ